MNAKILAFILVLILSLIGVITFLFAQGQLAGTVISNDNQFGSLCGSKALIDNAFIPLFDVSVVDGAMVGGTIQYVIHLGNNIDDHQSQTGIITFATVRKGSVYYTDIKNPAANQALAKSAGTFTDTWQITSGTNNVTVSVRINTSLLNITHFHIHYKLNMLGWTEAVTIR